MGSTTFTEGTIKFYKVSTHLLVACMVISTICGAIIVSDSGDGKYELSYAFKNTLGIPAWTSLPLIVSIVLGYLSVFLKSRRILAGKLAADVINIFARLLFILFASIFLMTGLHSCIKKSSLPEESIATDDFDFGFKVGCSVHTIARVRLEFGLYIVIMIMESVALVTLCVSCIVFCTQCRRNCSRSNNRTGILYYNQNEDKVKIEEKKVLNDV